VPRGRRASLSAGIAALAAQEIAGRTRLGGAGNRRPDKCDATMAARSGALNVPGKIREHSAGFKPGRGREKVLRGAKN
jgi:hypothetical protein